MPSQSEENRLRETGNNPEKDDYQRFEHPPLDLLNFAFDGRSNVIEIGTTFKASARIYCPEIRVISRVGIVFEPKDPNDRSAYNLSTTNNDIVAYRCMNALTRIARVGEIVGKNGVPYVFPKSDIDGIAFQNDDDMPWIDIDLTLGFPGVAGKWTLYYHATSNNKLKRLEWEGYISRVTASVQNSPGTVKFGGGG